MSEKPISDLRRRMLEDMAVRRMGTKTTTDYIKHVETFTRFLGRSPDTATGEDLRRFQVHEMQAGSRPPKMNTQVSALRFFFGKTLGRLTSPTNSPASIIQRSSRACCRWTTSRDCLKRRPVPASSTRRRSVSLTVPDCVRVRW